jgi:hypothetical protein
VAVCGVGSIAVELYEDGDSFGDTGPYEVVRGALRYRVDPTTGAGQRIVDLDRAPATRTGS